MLALVVLTLLCSSYCAVQSMPVWNMTIPLMNDTEMWQNVGKVNTSYPLLSRTTNSNESVHDIIIKVNAHERGKINGRSDSDLFMFEADIAMNKSEVFKLMFENSHGNTTRRKRAVMRKTSRSLWKKSISYALDIRLLSQAQTVIKSAIREWEQTLTCMGPWVDVTGRSRPRDYLYFFQGGGCYSQVGHQGGQQRVSIGRGCEHHGIAVHEIGHAIGLWHEQSRPDRDSYVRINWRNIIPGMEFNFQKYTATRIDSLGEDYDYGSVMHYGATAFARTRGVQTIVNIGGNQRLGQRNGLSSSDKKQVEKLYGCTPTTTTKKPSGCVNKDSKQNCDYWTSKGHCKTTSKYYNYMQTNCCDSCPSCQNKQSRGNCESWMRLGYCAKPHKYYNYMQKNCCNTCLSAVKKKTCHDKSSHCPYWKMMYSCGNGRYTVKDNCKKTCGLCNST